MEPKYVTGQTTLAELAILRGKLGVTTIHVMLDHISGRVFGDEATRVKAVLHHVAHRNTVEPFETTTGLGRTEAEALNDAFTKLTHLIGQEISRQGIKA